MKERPILFSGAMVRAILANRKGQTRRVVKGDAALLDAILPGYAARCRYGQPGDRLWVRETYMPTQDGRSVAHYRADHPLLDGIHPGWRPSIHMPRWASRITLEITGVRVERLNSISGDDALREGVTLPQMLNRFHVADPTVEFMSLWDSINGKTYPWASNPWVWVVEFKPL